MTQEELIVKVEAALDEIRPFLQSDGGDISLLSIDGGKVARIQLEGACVGLFGKSDDVEKRCRDDHKEICTSN